MSLYYVLHNAVECWEPYCEEFKHLIDDLREKPEIICIEETRFCKPGYKCERKARERIYQEGDVQLLLKMELSIKTECYHRGLD